MDDLLQHFIVEAHELIQQATDDLLALERDPQASAPMDSAFRAVHTLKGSVGLFDFAPMGIALHAAEDLLGDLRERRDGIDAPVIDSLLACIGQTERWVAIIEQTGQLPPDAAEEGYRLARALRSQLDADPAQNADAVLQDRSRLDRGTGGPEPQPRKLGGTGCTAGSDPVHAARRLLFLGRRPDCAPALGSRSDGNPALEPGSLAARGGDRSILMQSEDRGAIRR